MKETGWDNLDWGALDRLREIFLSEQPPSACYWTSSSDLADYDFTFGRRVAWKWDAVLRELRWRGWKPLAGAVLDWGCGSGVAGRRVIEHFGPDRFQALYLHDRSALAMDFAEEAARRAFPKLEAKWAGPGLLSGEVSIGLLVVSHVLTELDERERGQLLRTARRAEAILWVEPGTHRASRDLIGVRERLREDFHILAPCTHQARCGLLAPGNERHWCHNFADTPPGIMGDSAWVRFARRAGIDLRRLPYSFLALERPGPAPQGGEGCSRIIGEPRYSKGYARVFSCQEDGGRELTLRKRDAPGLFKALKECGEAPTYRWRLAEDRIVGAHRPGDE
jgi:hypothetical protein